LSLSEAGILFKMLADTKACIWILIGYQGPTQYYWKGGAHSQRWPMWRPAWDYLWVTVGQLGLIRSREPIHNVGQGKDLHANIHASLLANPSLLEAGSLFKMLADAKACIWILIGYQGPTWMYWKQGAHSQCWAMQRPACKYLWVAVGKPELIGSGSPFITLANMTQKLINYRGPTQAYQKEGTHLQC
jgi:hypothetical protein